MQSGMGDGGPLPDPRLDGVEFSVLRLDGPFSLTLPVTQTLNFYFLRRGKVLFECNGPVFKRAVLTPNTCVGLSARISHTFKNAEAESSGTEVTVRREALGTPGQDESVEIVFGSVPEESILYVRAFQEVPMIFPEVAPGIADSIRRAIDWIERESVNLPDDPISTSIIRRMAEIINMEIGRFSRIQEPEVAMLVHAARIDRRILRVLTSMHREPARQWTLQSLAEEACMSRTGFAERYRELTGTTPLQGLQRLRLRRAADQLINAPWQAVEQIAMNWGYQSGAVFIRAFTREFGMSPGRWRHASTREQ